MTLWDFLAWLATFDLNPAGEGLNWFSVLCFGLMGLYSLRKSLKSAKPFKLKKIPLVVASAVFPLLFYYCLLDITVGLVFCLTRTTPIEAFAIELGIRMTPSMIPVPGSYLLVPFLAFFTYMFGKGFNYERFGLILFLNVIIQFLTILAFNTNNMRMLVGPSRAMFYIFSFVPMWIIWAFSYTLVWREKDK